MWPAAVYNMGLVRSAWGRLEQCDLDMDDYSMRGKLWGKMPIVSMSLFRVLLAFAINRHSDWLCALVIL